jgi:hypothetical protein
MKICRSLSLGVRQKKEEEQGKNVFLLIFITLGRK